MLTVLRFLIALSLVVLTFGVIPTGQIKIYGRTDYLYGAPGTFSSSLPTYTSYGRLLEPTNAADGCEPVITKLAKSVQYYLLVSRGTCSFQDKQSAAYYAGAKGVIVYNTLEGIYQGQNYSTEMDYECDNGEGYISTVTYPVYSDAMDASMPTSCTGNSKCDSGKCIVTNYTDATLGTKVCCAWDLYLTMGSDDDAGDPVDLPAVFIRMQDLEYIRDLPDSNIEIQLYQRPLYWEFVSILLLYSMAVGTLTYGAYRVAMTDRKEFNDQEIEEMRRKKRSASLRPNTGATSSYSDTCSDVDQKAYQGDESDLEFAQSNPILSAIQRKGAPIEPASDDEEQKPRKVTRDEETVELRSEHAIAFVICSSLFLILLYLVDVTRIVTFIYLLLAALACSVICVYPFYRNFIRFILMASRGISHLEAMEFMSSVKSWKKHLPSAAAFATCFVLVIVWYINRSADWAWVLQDFMGICVCLLCLETILIPNLKVATALLCLAFFYDIFFVFISPYVFHSSVMEEVATGSNDANSDPNYCEKYPDDETYCADNSLPMLLQVPTLFTYLEGNSILGLGDVVLPGLLAVWAARHDIRQFGKLDFDQFMRGFFPLAVKMYCLGLLLADGAVMIFSTGQPALLYIVPCLLGSILYRSFHNDSLATLWNELPTMKLVALPIQSDEQVSLLSNANVVVAEAIWNKTREHDFITVLDHTHISPIPTSANSPLAAYQSSIMNSSTSASAAVPSKFVRHKDKKKNSSSFTEAVVTTSSTGHAHAQYSPTHGNSIVDSNTSFGAERNEDTLHSFVAPSGSRNIIEDDDGEPI